MSARALIFCDLATVLTFSYTSLVTAFALIGAAGFVAPRHLQAIADVEGQLEAAADPSDSVGVLDRLFPQTRFFTEIERFDRHLEKMRRKGRGVDYVSICSPNFLHDAHVRLALRSHAHAICEKPLVISPWNLDALSALEQEFERKVWTILQLRHLPSILELQSRARDKTRRHRVELHYVTPRGPWYDVSWKGQPERSGGIAMNIGVHFFDLLLWLYGPCEELQLLDASPRRMRGEMVLRDADVSWLLSVESADLSGEDQSPERHMLVDGTPVDLSAQPSTPPHTASYHHILSGGGFGIEEARPAIELVHRLRQLRS